MKVIETYREFGSYEMNSLNKEPSSINVVSYKRFKITSEKVSTLEEDREVLQELWNNCTNYHMWGSFNKEAKLLDFELVGSMGNKKR